MEGGTFDRPARNRGSVAPGRIQTVLGHALQVAKTNDLHGSCNGCSFSIGHGLGNGDGSLGAADAWLQTVAGAILGRPEFNANGDGLLILVVDERNTATGGGNPHTVIEDDTK